MKYSLEYIWECLNITQSDATEEEKRLMKIVAKNEEALINAVNEEQAKLLENLQESISNFINSERKEAFIKGIKFATQFLFEASKE